MSDYDDKSVERSKIIRSIKETKTGRARAMEPHAPLPSSSFVAEFLLHGLSSEEIMFNQLGIPSIHSSLHLPSLQIE